MEKYEHRSFLQWLRLEIAAGRIKVMPASETTAGQLTDAAGNILNLEELEKTLNPRRNAPTPATPQKPL